MRKLSPAIVFLLVPLVGGCDAEPVSPADDGLRTESAREARAGNADHASASLHQQLRAVRQATVAYHDLDAARAAGYHLEAECISAETLGAPAELGAMGYHAVNPTLIDGTFEPLKPEALVYERRGDGSYHLVAVEYLFTGEEAPVFDGTVHFHPFIPPFADFALHAWVWQGNPNGTFAEFNPNVSCPTV